MVETLVDFGWATRNSAGRADQRAGWSLHFSSGDPAGVRAKSMRGAIQRTSRIHNEFSDGADIVLRHTHNGTRVTIARSVDGVHFYVRTTIR